MVIHGVSLSPPCDSHTLASLLLYRVYILSSLNASRFTSDLARQVSLALYSISCSPYRRLSASLPASPCDCPHTPPFHHSPRTFQFFALSKSSILAASIIQAIANRRDTDDTLSRLPFGSFSRTLSAGTLLSTAQLLPVRR